MRSHLISQLLEWRWAPCLGLVLGSGAFVVLAVGLIPDHFAEVASPSAPPRTLPAEPARSPAPAIVGVSERAAASDPPSLSDPSDLNDPSDPSGAPSPSERHARRRLHRTRAAAAPSTTGDSVSSFFPEAPPEALPPPLPDTPPPPEPPAPTANTGQ